MRTKETRDSVDPMEAHDQFWEMKKEREPRLGGEPLFEAGPLGFDLVKGPT
jgi:hypothetical protein